MGRKSLHVYFQYVHHVAVVHWAYPDTGATQPKDMASEERRALCGIPISVILILLYLDEPPTKRPEQASLGAGNT